MTQNPFGDDANPFGSLDLGAVLEQAQQMQAQLLAAQTELAATVIEGTSGGVTVTITGTGDLSAVSIAPGSVELGDPDSLADLGDLVVAAFRDAKSKADALATDALGAGPGAGPLGFGSVGG